MCIRKVPFLPGASQKGLAFLLVLKKTNAKIPASVSEMVIRFKPCLFP